MACTRIARFAPVYLVATSMAVTSSAAAQSPLAPAEPWAPPEAAASAADELVEGEQPAPRRSEPIEADEPPAARDSAVAGTHPTTFLLRARLPLAFGQITVLVAGPRLAAGVRFDRVELTLGVGLSFGSGFEETTEGGFTTLLALDYFALIVAPSIAYVLAQSSDRMSRMHLAASAFIGTDQRDYEDGTSVSATVYGGSVALGGEHRLAPMLGLGVETGFGFLLASGSATTATSDHAGVFAAIFATVYAG